MKPSQISYVPSHPGLFNVQFVDGDFSSYLTSLKPFEAGDLMTPFTGLTRSPKAYTSVQCGPDHNDNVELNSDLVYVNHSCEPNVGFDLSSKEPKEWHVRALKRIHAGDTLTFFYPSTEWDMEQPFDCQCGAKTCLGFIQGAAQLSAEQLYARGFLNSWIRDLVAERDAPIPQRSSNGTPPNRNNSPDSGDICPSCGYGFSASGDITRCGCKRDTF